MEEMALRDTITIKDEKGRIKDIEVEALFDMNHQTYALLWSEGETYIMQVEQSGNEQYLIGISNDEEKEMLLDAYQIAVEVAPAMEI